MTNTYAGFWIRLLAWILDGIILWLPVFAIGLAFTWITGFETPSYVLNALLVGLIIYLDGVKGGTPGKHICGIQIVDEANAFIGIPRAILRQIGKIYSMLLIGIGYLMIAFDEKKQGLHDQLAKTYVVYKKK